MLYEIVADWYAGDDPGMNAWAVMGASNAYLVAATGGEAITSWVMLAYDLSVDPDLPITPDANGSGNANTGHMASFNSPQLDGYWTRGGSGYNVRHYIANADFTTTPFVAGHEYLFVYKLQTPAWAVASGGWGQITLRRRGRCIPPPP